MTETQNQNEFISKRLRLAGFLIAVGLVVEGLSLTWNHPLSFVAFLGIGGLLLLLGIVVYLTALVSPRQS
jgi:hypothetical protein